MYQSQASALRRKLMSIMLVLVTLGFMAGAQSASILIIDADVEDDGDWTANISSWNAGGFGGLLTPGHQEGSEAAVMNNGHSISQTFGTQVLQTGTYTVEFSMGNYSNFPFPGIDIDFTGMDLSSASVLSQTLTPASGDWELWQVIWEVGAGNANLGDALSFSLTGTGIPTTNMAFDGVGALSANGNGFLVSHAAVPVPAAVWLFGSALGLLGWMRRKSM